MRHLLLLILSFFFFVARAESKAGEVAGKQSLKGIENKNSGKELFDYSISDDSSPISLRRNSRNSNTQFRLLPYTNFVNTITFVNKAKFLPAKKHFVATYFYCKPIGLKLVFPQHYYW
jgi:hypothetical protein